MTQNELDLVQKMGLQTLSNLVKGTGTKTEWDFTEQKVNFKKVKLFYVLVITYLRDIHQ